MTSNPNFGVSTTATEVAAAFSDQIHGKTVLIVGVSPNSIGEYLALSTASQSPTHLFLASRTPSNINSVITKIRALCPNITTIISTIIVDLASQASIRHAAAEIQYLTPKLDIILNNAAINVQTYQTTMDGLELQFGVNHIGLFLLTNLLTPLLLSAAQSSSSKGATRVVNLTSVGHRLSPIRFSDPGFQKLGKDIPEGEQPPKGLPKSIYDEEEKYSPFVGYGQSKTGNLLMSLELNERLGARGVVSYSVHPGSIWTNLARDLDEGNLAIIKGTSNVWKTVDQGAATAMVAAFDPALSEPKGKEVYLLDCQFGEAAPWAVDRVMAERLWVLSEELVGQKFEFGVN